jgi:hypothetical protein
MTKRIVVARFNENLDWLNEIKFHGDILIINKGERIESRFKTIEVQNVGFEANSYLSYIINNYNNLTDITYFLQGNPYDHCDRSELSEALRADHISFCPVGRDHNIVHSNGEPNHPGLDKELKKIWNTLFNVLPPDKWHFFFGAQFGVNKKLIRRRGLYFYRKALDAIKTKEDACAIERIWQYIFCS